MANLEADTNVGDEDISFLLDLSVNEDEYIDSSPSASPDVFGPFLSNRSTVQLHYVEKLLRNISSLSQTCKSLSLEYIDLNKRYKEKRQQNTSLRDRRRRVIEARKENKQSVTADGAQTLIQLRLTQYREEVDAIRLLQSEALCKAREVWEIEPRWHRALSDLKKWLSMNEENEGLDTMNPRLVQGKVTAASSTTVVNGSAKDTEHTKSSCHDICVPESDKALSEPGREPLTSSHGPHHYQPVGSCRTPWRTQPVDDLRTLAAMAMSPLSMMRENHQSNASSAIPLPAPDTLEPHVAAGVSVTYPDYLTDHGGQTDHASSCFLLASRSNLDDLCSDEDENLSGSDEGGSDGSTSTTLTSADRVQRNPREQSAPVDILSTLVDIQSSPINIPFTPGHLPSTPMDILPNPVDIENASVDTSAPPVGIPSTSADIASATKVGTSSPMEDSQNTSLGFPSNPVDTGIELTAGMNPAAAENITINMPEEIAKTSDVIVTGLQKTTPRPAYDESTMLSEPSSNPECSWLPQTSGHEDGSQRNNPEDDTSVQNSIQTDTTTRDLNDSADTDKCTRPIPHAPQANLLDLGAELRSSVSRSCSHGTSVDTGAATGCHCGGESKLCTLL